MFATFRSAAMAMSTLPTTALAPLSACPSKDTADFVLFHCGVLDLRMIPSGTASVASES